MKRTMIVLIALAILPLLFTSATAGQSLVDTVVNGCKVEIEKYCAQVTPGEGRVLACLFAYEDKLSAKCEYALYPRFRTQIKKTNFIKQLPTKFLRLHLL